jgi:hypothetical protein
MKVIKNINNILKELKYQRDKYKKHESDYAKGKAEAYDNIFHLILNSIEEDTNMTYFEYLKKYFPKEYDKKMKEEKENKYKLNYGVYN